MGIDDYSPSRATLDACDAFCDPSLKRIAQVVFHLRSHALEKIECLSATEFRLALISRVFCMARYSQLRSDAQRHLAFAYAGFLSERLSASLTSHAQASYAASKYSL